MKNLYFYKGANPTVDLVIINPNNEILLIKRSNDAVACPGMWAIPGGFIDSDAKKGNIWDGSKETPEAAAVREVQEETNLVLKDPYLYFIGCFEGNNRDPRDNEESWSKSFAYLHLIDRETFEQQKNNIRGLDDAEEAKWFSVEEVNNTTLAFDHGEIIKQGLKMIQQNKKIKKMN